MSSPRKPAAAKLPYPELPETSSPRWYLAWYLRQLAELEAVAAHWRHENAKRLRNEPLVMALIGLEHAISNEIKKQDIPDVIRTGQLLFAVPSTTALQVAA